MTTFIRKIFNAVFLHIEMQITLLKNIVASAVGSSATGVVDLLYDKKNVNEFLIAKKLKLTINQTRNILYRLADEGLVSFIRKKDSTKGGWYTYFWTLNSGKGLMKFRGTLVSSIEQLGQTIARRAQGRFFFCATCQLEFSEEVALGHQYTCPECGQVLELKDTKQEVIQHQKELAKLQQLLAEVELEVAALTKKEEQSRTRRHKHEERKKSAARAAARALTRKRKGLPEKKELKKKSIRHSSRSSKKKSRAKSVKARRKR